MQKQHDFETIFTSNDVMKTQYVIVKVFEYREKSYSMRVNAYYGPRQTNRPHATPNYRHEKSNFEVDYYRQIYFSPEELAHTRKKN